MFLMQHFLLFYYKIDLKSIQAKDLSSQHNIIFSEYIFSFTYIVVIFPFVFYSYFSKNYFLIFEIFVHF